MEQITVDDSNSHQPKSQVLDFIRVLLAPGHDSQFVQPDHGRIPEHAELLLIAPERAPVDPAAHGTLDPSWTGISSSLRTHSIAGLARREKLALGLLNPGWLGWGVP